MSVKPGHASAESAISECYLSPVTCSPWVEVISAEKQEMGKGRAVGKLPSASGRLSSLLISTSRGKSGFMFYVIPLLPDMVSNHHILLNQYRSVFDVCSSASSNSL